MTEPEFHPAAMLFYDELDESTAAFVAARTSEIRALVRRAAADIIEIGGKLIEVKERLGHGRFGEWLEREFGWTDRMARRFMNVADKFGKTDNLSDLTIAPSALYLLAAPSTPEAAVEEAVALAGDGGAVTYSQAREIVERHKTPEPERFICGDCGEIFDRTVWHCPYCDHHWDAGRRECPNCYNDRATEREAATVRDIRGAAPDLFEKVYTGEMTIPQARREVTARNKREAPPLPTDKYRVIYADPPWRYGNSGVINDGDNYGRAERHYPTMSIEELCALPVREMAAGDAVLFLWVTSPLLEECFAVARAWGFAYKASFIWDKVRHNFGNYNSVRHELLLVCTRGSCTPDVKELFDSVQTVERSAVHSEKPEAFRAIIDTLYPRGRRIELFARRAADGWETWGNETDD